MLNKFGNSLAASAVASTGGPSSTLCLRDSLHTSPARPAVFNRSSRNSRPIGSQSVLLPPDYTCYCW
ncbi:hypothetical protein AAFF_G00389460 [Aldrovandia affinis]|uniref:Uncharacterized protein n=1 Tax=Aldrovandia affinis TaxID=143900 RepID=A0AAD7SEA0_9TELE|nr:hypothetical protein AAFF_G00389460 [Aldrovandia affinis]